MQPAAQTSAFSPYGSLFSTSGLNEKKDVNRHWKAERSVQKEVQFLSYSWRYMEKKSETVDHYFKYTHEKISLNSPRLGWTTSTSKRFHSSSRLQWTINIAYQVSREVISRNHHLSEVEGIAGPCSFLFWKFCTSHPGLFVGSLCYPLLPLVVMVLPGSGQCHVEGTVHQTRSQSKQVQGLPFVPLGASRRGYPR